MAGRPVKTYTASYDRSIRLAGLSRQPDGRWRVLTATGEKRFTEPDERRAIERSKTLLGLDILATTAVETTVGQILGKDTPDSLDRISSSAANILAHVLVNNDEEYAEAETIDSLPIRFRRQWIIPRNAHAEWFRLAVAADEHGPMIQSFDAAGDPISEPNDAK